jgi:hypothetical protein
MRGAWRQSMPMGFKAVGDAREPLVNVGMEQVKDSALTKEARRSFDQWVACRFVGRHSGPTSRWRRRSRSDAASGGVSLPACTSRWWAPDSHSVSWAIARSGESSVTVSLAPDLIEHVHGSMRSTRWCVRANADRGERVAGARRCWPDQHSLRRRSERSADAPKTAASPTCRPGGRTYFITVTDAAMNLVVTETIRPAGVDAPIQI